MPSDNTEVHRSASHLKPKILSERYPPIIWPYRCKVCFNLGETGYYCPFVISSLNPADRYLYLVCHKSEDSKHRDHPGGGGDEGDQNGSRKEIVALHNQHRKLTRWSRGSDKDQRGQYEVLAASGEVETWEVDDHMVAVRVSDILDRVN